MDPLSRTFIDADCRLCATERGSPGSDGHVPLIPRPFSISHDSRAGSPHAEEIQDLEPRRALEFNLLIDRQLYPARHLIPAVRPFSLCHSDLQGSPTRTVRPGRASQSPVPAGRAGSKGHRGTGFPGTGTATVLPCNSQVSAQKGLRRNAERTAGKSLPASSAFTFDPSGASLGQPARRPPEGHVAID